MNTQRIEQLSIHSDLVDKVEYAWTVNGIDYYEVSIDGGAEVRLTGDQVQELTGITVLDEGAIARP